MGKPEKNGTERKGKGKKGTGKEKEKEAKGKRKKRKGRNMWHSRVVINVYIHYVLFYCLIFESK